MMTLFGYLCERIQQNGPMLFSEFMHHALYAPLAGYYSAGLQKFGPGGDFITAPELTPLFGQTLAMQCQQILAVLSDPIVFEFGAGSGQLCVDLLTHLEQLDCLPREYHILEVSSHLRHRQQALIALKIPHLLPRVQWLSAWPKQSFNGVVIANEVLDAMPVSRFLQTAAGLFESHIALNAQGLLHEVYTACDNSRLNTHVRAVLPRDLFPYQSEANLFIDDWLQACYDMLERGAVILLDYGFPQHEYYHPDRNQGTLMCHYHHRAHTNPLINLGEQDITAHVDFTHVAEAGSKAGFHVAGFTTQASFLLANGLLNLLSGMTDGHARMKAQQAVKQLVQPNEMGELFKVISLTKQLDMALNGFQLQDRRASL